VPSGGQGRGKKFATLEQAISSIILAKADYVPSLTLGEGVLPGAAAATTGIFTKTVELTTPATARLQDSKNSQKREGFYCVSG